MLATADVPVVIVAGRDKLVAVALHSERLCRTNWAPLGARRRAAFFIFIAARFCRLAGLAACGSACRQLVRGLAGGVLDAPAAGDAGD
jgi:hypothetical protein